MNPPYSTLVVGSRMPHQARVSTVAARPVCNDRDRVHDSTTGGRRTRSRAVDNPHHRMLFPLILCHLENAARLALPFAIGLAVTGLATGTHVGLAALICQQLVVLLLTALRRMVLVRAGAAMQTAQAGGAPTRSDTYAGDDDQESGRSGELRRYAEQLQEWLPQSVSVLYAVVGGAVALAVYDWTLIAGCLALLIPTILISIAQTRSSGGSVEGTVRDRANERQILQQGDLPALSHWHAELGRRRVREIDGTAMSRAVLDLFTLTVIAASLVQMFAAGIPPHGDLLAMVLYLGFFVRGLQHVPALFDEFRYLQNAGRRIRST